jgi:phosphoglycolate phosphatase-like HAD superfamily hydrolase
MAELSETRTRAQRDPYMRGVETIHPMPGVCRYKYFDAVVVSGDEPHAKPHRHMFDTALQRCGGTSMARVVMVGDSITADIKVDR